MTNICFLHIDDILSKCVQLCYLVKYILSVLMPILWIETNKRNIDAW